MIDELDFVRGLRPPVADHPAAVDRARGDLMALIDEGPVGAKHWWRRRRVVAVAIAALVTAAAAWVVGNVATTTGLGCHVPNNGIAIVDAETGDPVVDCGRVWRRDYGIPPPPLVAYDNGMGGIEVVPDAEEVPASWRQLEPGVVQDLRLIELGEALDDYVIGLQARCYNIEDAQLIATRELARLELEGWTVDTGPNTLGPEACSYFYLDAARSRVVLIGLGTPFQAPNPSAVSFGQQLHDALSEECMTVADAEAAATSLASEAGLKAIDQDLVVRIVVDDYGDCARGYVSLGAAVQVTLRGPNR